MAVKKAKWGAIKAKIPEIMGAYEVSKELDVPRSNLQYIRDLPEPFMVLKCGSIYLADEIREFAPLYAARRRKKPGEGG